MGWSRPEYAQLATLIAEQTGLTFPPSRQADLERALGEALDDTTSDARLRELLAGETAARDELIASLTIGESYFFRDPGQFRLLREEILPGIAALRGDAPIRLWSAGCAAGEEAYSLAIVAAQLGLRRATVLGTDISRVRLAAARAASYTQWALRGVDAETVERYFTRSGKRYVLRPKYRESVDFRYLNLAEDRYPSLTAGIWGFDLILCRNVLIYFDNATIARVAQRLIDSLSDDGWLMLGASDPAISELVDCEVELTPAGLVYRRRSGRKTGRAAVGGWDAPAGYEAITADDAGSVDAMDAWLEASSTSDADRAHAPDEVSAPAKGAAPTEAAAETGVSALDQDAHARAAAVTGSDVPADLLAAYAARDYGRAAALAAARLAAHDTADVRVLRVRSLANMGDLAAAGKASAAALERHRDSAELLYLHALLLVEAGQPGDAAAAARRALYLDRSLVVAHLTLALALNRTGEHTGARRALQNAASLLSQRLDDEVVPASDGETVGRLRTNVEAQLRLLEGAAWGRSPGRRQRMNG
ncbi:MAG TPA: protein-glutamate O-methyltransferase CheR [Longimicrobiales bacterium]|nr:protein-glutamate O-methyltransferase CheR [Longimicrobiales bacterium]